MSTDSLLKARPGSANGSTISTQSSRISTKEISQTDTPNDTVKDVIPHGSESTFTDQEEMREPPKILYKLRYRNSDRDVIYLREDSKPFEDLQEVEDVKPKVPEKKGPIFEIVTMVTVHDMRTRLGKKITPTYKDVLNGTRRDGTMEPTHRVLKIRLSTKKKGKKPSKGLVPPPPPPPLPVPVDMDFGPLQLPDMIPPGRPRSVYSSSASSDSNDSESEGSRHRKKKQDHHQEDCKVPDCPICNKWAGLSGKLLDSSSLRINTIDQTYMVIKSAKLKAVIRAIVDYHPDQHLGGDSIAISEPYCILHHYSEALADICGRAEKSGSPDTERLLSCQAASAKKYHADVETVEHIRILLDFLDKGYKEKIEAEKQRWKKSPPVATHEMLWLLFKPGTRVFADVKNGKGGFIVRSFDPVGSLELWSLSFDGTEIGCRTSDHHLFPFSGEREISSLPICPVQYYHEPDMEQKRINRGKKYFDVLKSGFMQVDYDGTSHDVVKKKVRGRVVFDPSSYYESEKGADERPELEDPEMGLFSTGRVCSCAWCTDELKRNNTEEPGSDELHKSRFLFQEIQDINPKEVLLKSEVQETLFFLLPRMIRGFVLKERVWRTLDINQASGPISGKEKALETLAMPDHNLAIIKALSVKFTRMRANWSADFIMNKGEGQIFLLHGPPGVGKTYTAECTAEYTGRTLLQLTCADIGTNETEMEARLAEWFALAETWGAVMLIDEADVYLEERARGDIQRNSLVSAFLRSMEYYRGILFLTTNRIGHMDLAIMSRIHIILHYEPLSTQYKRKIWEDFFSKLEAEREDIYIEKRAKEFILEEDTMTATNWNGREIRNAFQTAVALAESDAFLAQRDRQRTQKAQDSDASSEEETVRLKIKHFDQVVRMSQSFKDHFYGRFKGSEAKHAEEDEARLDYPNVRSKSGKGRGKGD
ncbi:MAG: hypothetical protein Q9157_004733 [Trypethelium eluteriae]